MLLKRVFNVDRKEAILVNAFFSLCLFRDLKPENVLLNDDMHIQITDFGSAKIVEKANEGWPPLACAL